MVRGVILQEFKHPTNAAGYISYYNPQSTRPAHFHGQLEVLIVTRGRLSCLIQQTQLEVVAPALIWHLPTVSHQTLSASPDCFFWVALFEPELARSVLATRRSIAARSLPTRLSRMQDDSSCARGCGPFSSWVLGLTNLVSTQPSVEIRASMARRLEELAFTAFHAQGRLGSAQLLGRY
jgi:hypothetical protein